jgi:hypothetical protein
MAMVNPPSESCAVAFKEWAGVCDALIAGCQSVVVRKGGISEPAGPGVFVAEYPQFWLFPTWVHQAEQGLRRSAGFVPVTHRFASDGLIPICALVRVDLIGLVEREEMLSSLEEFHVFTALTIAKRFHYRRPGLWIMGARVYRREPEFMLAATPEQAGCKTWVTLEQPLATTGLAPVLDDAEWADRKERLRTILGCQ